MTGAKAVQIEVQHSPTLNTITMVEKTLKSARQLLTMAELKRKLPRKVMHGTLIQILEYLQESGKILIFPKGVVWTYMPPEQMERWKREGLQL
jgi:hypothetical protein